jgi:polyphosphate kinase
MDDNSPVTGTDNSVIRNGNGHHPIVEQPITDGKSIMTPKAAPVKRRRGPVKTRPAAPKAPSEPKPFTNSELYLNRELSWLAFNGRVFAEATDLRNPLLERVKFVSIGNSNLDEFYMIRVAGLQQHLAAGLSELSADGMTLAEQLSSLRTKVGPMLQRSTDIFKKELIPDLAKSGIHILEYSQLTRAQHAALKEYFKQEVFPVLTPLALGPGHPFPHISNLSLNLAVVVRDPAVGERFARMKVPGVLPRLVACPAPPHRCDEQHFVWLEQVIAANLKDLFPGLRIIESHPFRVTRDADIAIQEDEASDLLHTVEQGLQRRHFGDVCRLEINSTMPERVRNLLEDNLLIDPNDVYAINGPLGLSDVMELYKISRADLKDPPFIPAQPKELLGQTESMLDVIAKQDLLLHHPYDSFHPVIDFIET